MRNSLILIIKINFSGQNRPQFHFRGIIWIHQVINDQYSITHKSIWYFQIECSMDRCKGLYFVVSPIRTKDYLVWKLSSIYWYSLPLFCTEIPLMTGTWNHGNNTWLLLCVYTHHLIAVWPSSNFSSKSVQNSIS